MATKDVLVRLFDDSSFIEIGKSVIEKERATEPTNVITGYGQVNGRLVFAIAEDRAVSKGAFSMASANKIIRLNELALKVGAPVVSIFDSKGTLLKEGIEVLSAYGQVFKNSIKACRNIPQISLIIGDCIGSEALIANLADFIFMIDKKSHMFMSGPELLEHKGNVEINADTIGSARINSEISGNADFCASNEDEAINSVRNLFSYLPQNCKEKSEELTGTDDLNRTTGEIAGIVSTDKYDMKKVIVSIADNGNFFEIKGNYAKNITTGFIRLGGKVVGVVANNPVVDDGALTVDGVDKGARFVKICDSFNIPILTLVDTIGYKASVDEENSKVIKQGTKMMFAYSKARVPLVTLVVGKAYGSAYITMCSKDIGADIVYSLKKSEIGLINAKAAANILYSDEIRKSKDPTAEWEKREKEYIEQCANSQNAASHSLVDGVIDEDEVRKVLISAFDMLETKVK